jgi:hypothetical protein
MTQLDISFAPPAQNTDTSRAAAKAIQPCAQTLRWQVLGAIKRSLEYGCTDEEIQTQLGMAGSTERPRRTELVSAGLVVDSGLTRPTASGRQAIVWRCV